MGGLIGGPDFLDTFPALANNSTLLGATVAICAPTFLFSLVIPG
jgi:hypothetical protein